MTRSIVLGTSLGCPHPFITAWIRGRSSGGVMVLVRTDPPVILVMHGNAVLGQAITGKMRDWCDGSIDALWVEGEEGIERTLRELGETNPPRRLVGVMASYRQNEDRWNEIDELIRQHCPNAGPLTRFPDDDAFNPAPLKKKQSAFLDKAAERKFEQAMESLFRQWQFPDAEIRLKGAEAGSQAANLQRFLFLHGIPYLWNANEDSEITAETDWNKNFPGKLGHLYEELLLDKSKRKTLDYQYDVVIVGAGPAGLSAALGAGIKGLSTLLIDENRPGGSAVTSINLIQNYLGFPGGITGTKLVKLALEQLQDVEVDVRPTICATGIERDGKDRYWVTVEDANDLNRVSAGLILIAGGQEPNRLFSEGSIGEKDEVEAAATMDIRYIMETHHANDVDGMNVVIVGGGDTAGEAALLYTRSGANVAMATKAVLMADATKREVEKEVTIHRGVKSVNFLKRATGIDVQLVLPGGEALLPAKRVHVLIGGKPHTEWLTTCGVKVKLEKKRGYVLTDKWVGRGGMPFCTSEDGIFAVGDVRINASRRVAQAVGQGMAAVAAMEAYLRTPEGRHRKPPYVWERVLSRTNSSEWRRASEVLRDAGASG